MFYIDWIEIELPSKTSKIEDEIHREFILKKLANEFDISYNTLEKRLLSLLSQNEKKLEHKEEIIAPKMQVLKKDKYYLATYALLYYMLVSKKCLDYYNEGKINFPNEEERFLASEISYYYQKYGTVTPADFYTYLQDKEKLLVVLKKVLELELDNEVTEKELNDDIKTLREYQVKEEIKKLEKKLKSETDIMMQVEIGSKIRDLNAKLKTNS